MNNEIHKIYKPKPKDEVTYFVNARQKTYLHSTEIYLPNNPYEKILDDYELAYEKAIPGPEESAKPSDPEELLERVTRRASTAIKDIALSNAFELFATFTFKDGRDNPERCRQRMSDWLKRQRKTDKSFQYIIVSEFHKDGISLHFHALIKGYEGNLVRAMNPNTGKPLVKRRHAVYDFPNYTLGHSEVYHIGDTEQDRIRSGFYLTKYVRKDMPVFANKKRYWRSRGLNKPQTIENPEEWYLLFWPDHMIENDYGKFLYFDNKRIEEYLP